MTSPFIVNSMVEVRSASEILATLDAEGRLDGLPFMPEMLSSIGKSYRIDKIAHKTCDTVSQTGGRGMLDTVHLAENRCDGSAHGGCDARCLLFWKTQWLKPATASGEASPDPSEGSPDLAAFENLRAISEMAATKRLKSEQAYDCQATLLLEASYPIEWWQPGQYWRDWRSGNTKLSRMFRVWFFHGLDKLMGMGVGYRVWRKIYDTLQPRFGGHTYANVPGRLPNGSPTPRVDLELQPGELVRVKSLDAILDTINEAKQNRGMRFDPEMAPYCGKTYRVSHRVNKLLNEGTGELITMKTPGVILDGVYCKSEMSTCRLFCPRALPSYWREVWLERVSDGEDGQ